MSQHIVGRDEQIHAQAMQGAKQAEIARKFGLSHTRIGQIVRTETRRVDGIEFLSIRAETFARRLSDHDEVTPAIVVGCITASELEKEPRKMREKIKAYVRKGGLVLRD